MAFQHSAGDAAGFAERNDVGNIFGPRPAAAFLAGSAQQRRQIDAAAHIERTNALRCVELVASDGEKVDAEFPDIDRDLADRLRSIDMNQRTVTTRDDTDAVSLSTRCVAPP